VLPWIAVASLLIAFVLTFFPWVGYYPGIPLETQNAWQAAFGSYWLNPDAPKAEAGKEPQHAPKELQHVDPRVSGLLIVFLVIFILTLLAALASAVLIILPNLLPQGLALLGGFSWAIVSAMTLLGFLLLVLQWLSGFDMVNQFQDRSKALGAKASELMAQAAPTPEGKKEAELSGATMAGLFALPARSTCSFRSAFWLILVALVCAFLTFVLSRRRNRPLPCLDLRW
jgi:hypothetical protein